MQATGTPSDGTVLPASIASSGHFKIPQLTVNEDGADVDFRVEGDTSTHLLFVDASTDRVGINTSTPGSKLHIDGGSTTNSVEIDGIGGHELYSYHDSGGVGWATGAGGTYGELLYLDESGSTARLYTGGTERFRVSGTEAVVNETGASVDFRVEGDTSTHLLFVDASADRVGINTSTPDIDGLHVTGGHGAGILAQSAGTTSGGLIRMRNTQSSTQEFYFAVGGGNNNFVQGRGLLLRDETNNANRIVLLTNGNVGIGQINPSEELVVRADAPSIQLESSNASGRNYGFQSMNDGKFHVYDGTAGENRLTFDSSGNVGIGTTSPAVKFVVSNGGAEGLEVSHSSGNVELNAYNRSTSARSPVGIVGQTFTVTTGNPTLNTGLFQNSSGNVGIGITSPDGKLHVTNGTAGSVTAATDANLLVLESNQSNGMSLLNDSAERAVIRFGTTGTSGQNEASISYAHEAVSTTADRRRMFFKTGGNGLRMSIGNSGSHAQIFMNCAESFSGAMLSMQTNGTTGIGIKAGATNQQFMINFRNPNGEVGTINTSGSSTSYNTSSDYRLKENAVAISDGITRLKTLKPYRFNFKTDASTTVDGFFAHEVTAVPEAITGTKDEVDENNEPVYQGIDQSKLVPLLVAAVQELITKVETLEAA